MFLESISSEEIDKKPLSAFEGEIYVVERPGKLFSEAVRYLRRQSVLGFDTETKPVFNAGEKHHPTALLQLSGPDRAYLFRLNTLGLRYRLRSILADKKIIKVGAAVKDDIRGLQHIAPFKAASFVDLQQMVEGYGIRDKAVKKMAAIILDIRISKSQQCSDWEARQYSEGQISYAATDAWVCLEMYKKLLESTPVGDAAEEA
ncbi:MAG: 3'-5' exonuclease domain-containing protein 2 [Bacteroidales bacterium]|nr:3'-5' exonuclease domain-containing protein 2 [Bacteroidales bacterium]